MRVQVVVTHGDRQWDSIRDSLDSALFRVGDHMVQDHDEAIARAGKKISDHLVFGGTFGECVVYLVDNGYTVKKVEITNPTF